LVVRELGFAVLFGCLQLSHAIEVENDKRRFAASLLCYMHVYRGRVGTSSEIVSGSL
jgi:hypothetical protein